VSNENPSWDYVLPLWWAFFWRASVLSCLVGLVLGAIGGFIVGMLRLPPLAGGIVGGVLGWAGSIPVSILVFRHVLGKKYKSFSIQFVGSTG
jgi:hypothetical protein